MQKTIRHFTVTTYLFHQEKTLLIQHPKFHKWMPPGGHLEENETPPEGARREVLEETGLEIIFFPDEQLFLKNSLERPRLCLLEIIPSFGDQPAHEHIDLIFFAQPISLTPISPAAHQTQWFSYGEIEQLSVESQIFEDVYEVIKGVMAPVHVPTKKQRSSVSSQS